MLKQKIKEYLNQENNQIFNFRPLNECLNNLPNINHQIIPFDDEKMKRYKRVDIKYNNSSISSACIEFIPSSPNIELVFIKKYNDENIMQEEINFMHEITEKIDEYNNCIVHYITKENDNEVEITKTEYYYVNNEFLNKNEEIITLSKEEFKNYYKESLKSINPTDKEINYSYSKEERLELERKFVTLSNIYSLAKNYQENEKKTR